MTTPKLTGPQRALLARVRAEGVVVLNGRARRTVQALRDAGLVAVSFDLVPHASGSGIGFTEEFTLRPLDNHPVDEV